MLAWRKTQRLAAEGWTLSLKHVSVAVLHAASNDELYRMKLDLFESKPRR